MWTGVLIENLFAGSSARATPTVNSYGRRDSMRKQAATGLLNDLRSACFLILLATMFAPLVGLKAAGQNAAPDENAARAAKENELIKALNEKLMAASAASKAGDFDTAIKTLNQAAQLDSTRDLIWFKLGDA